MDTTSRIAETQAQSDALHRHTKSIVNTPNATPAHSEIFNHTSVLNKTYNMPSLDNASYNNTLTGRTTSQPRVSMEAQAMTGPILNERQESSFKEYAQSSRPLMTEGTAAVAALRPHPIRGLDDSSVAFKLPSFENRVPLADNRGDRRSLFQSDNEGPQNLTRPFPELENKISLMYRKPVIASKFDNSGSQSIDLSRHMSKFGNRIPHLNGRSQTWKNSTRKAQQNRFPFTVSSRKEALLPKASHQTLPQAPIHENKEIQGQKNIFTAQEAIDTSVEMTDAPILRAEGFTEAPEAPKTKQVRIALDSRNGLPKEKVAKFFRASYCGDWEPSSPWDSERVGHTELDLNGHLNSLKHTVSGSPVPPWTPVKKPGARYPESIAPGQDPDFHVERPNKVFTPPNAQFQTPHLNHDQVLGSPYDSTVITGASAQSPVIRGVNKEGQTAKDLEIEHGITSSLLLNPALETPERPAPANSYYRMMERVVNGVRKAVFLSPSPSRNIVQDATHIAHPGSAVMETSYTSIHMQDAPRLQESMSPTYSYDPPSVIDVDAIHDVGEIQYGVGGPSTENRQSGNETKTDVADTLSSNNTEVVEEGSDTARPGNVRSYDGKPSSPAAGADKQESASTLGADMFLEIATSEMAELGLSNKMTRKMKKAREAKEVALAKAKAEQEAKDAKARAEKEAAEAQAKAESEEAERKSQFQRRLPKQKLVQPLSHDWEFKIDEAMKQNGSLTTTSNGTDLTRHDLLSVLGDRKWLNDEIINGYIDWVVDYANKKSAKGANATPKVVAQNSFFYDKLSKEGPSSVSRWMRRKKAAGAKLLEVETVLIPVNNASHWTLIVVSPKARTIEYLDSFGGAGVRMVDNTKKWLKVELGALYNDNEWQVLDTASASQDNGYDCGVFVATNAECVVGGISTSSYSGDDMTDQRRRIAGVLLNKGFGNGREFIPAIDL